jgi:transketolase
VRNALAKTLYELAKADPRIVVIVADISPAGAMEDFRREYPDRFINVGVAEQSMIGLAAGLAQRGMKPVCYTIAAFALFRAYEFVRCDLAYQNLPVTIVGMGAGLSYSTLGGTHQAVEDVAVAMACPNMTVLAPCDPAETSSCIRWCMARESGGPVYLRLGKAGEPIIPTSGAGGGNLGQERVVYDAGDTCILSYGPIVAECVKAARSVGFNPPTVISVPWLRPLPDLSWVAAVFTDVLVVEEASGAPLAKLFREVVANLPADDAPARVKSLCLPDNFVHFHGTREELLDHVGLTAEKVLQALR